MNKFLQNISKDKVILFLAMAKISALIIAVLYIIDSKFKPLFWVSIFFVLMAIIMFSIRELKKAGIN
jgi:uncharacterized protein (DUF983 family)